MKLPKGLCVDLKRALRISSLAAVLAFSTSCEKSGSQFDPDEIRPRPISEKLRPTPDPNTGLVSESFYLPVNKALDLLKTAKISDSPLQRKYHLDPFGSSSSSDSPTQADSKSGTRVEPLHQALKNLGISFPDGTSATYDSENGQLAIVQSPEAMALIRQVVGSFREIPSTAAIRFEFYEVPALLALRLEQSSAPHFDDTPEWEALQKLLDEDEIRLLDVSTLQTKNGQRSKFEDGESFTFQSGWQSKEAEDDSNLVPIIEDRLVGTMIETEISIAADNHTVDMNFMIEYHSAPPEFFPTTSDPNDRISLPVTIFHVKKLVTYLSLHDGEVRLLTSWTPTGKPEFADRDRRILVFVSANLQREH